MLLKVGSPWSKGWVIGSMFLRLYILNIVEIYICWFIQAFVDHFVKTWNKSFIIPMCALELFLFSPSSNSKVEIANQTEPLILFIKPYSYFQKDEYVLEKSSAMDLF